MSIAFDDIHDDDDTPSELDPGWDAMNEGKFEEAAAIAMPFIQSDDRMLREEANRLAGHAYLQQRQPQNALPYFIEVARIDNSPAAHFNVVTAAALSGDTDLAERTMLHIADQLKDKDVVPGTISVPQATLYYAFALCETGHFDMAFEKLNWLRSLYEFYHTTDDEFLFEKGMPMLPHSLQLMGFVFSGMGSRIDTQSWVKEFASKVDESGQNDIQEFLQAA